MQQICDSRLVAILRHVPLAQLSQTVEALYVGGVRCIEIAADSPETLDGVKMLAQQWGDRMLVGAGTVLTREAARQYVDAGACFILSPIYDEAVIKETLDVGALPIPGIYTPTEAMQAVRYGATMVKLFPAVTVGSAFIRQVLAPLPELQIMAVGGVDVDNAAAFIAAGAVAVGIGSQLANLKLIEADDFTALQARAEAFVHAVSGI